MAPSVQEGGVQEAEVMAPPPASKPLDYVMVKHMGYSPETRRHRAMRPGQRRGRFTLDNGRQIRFKGERMTEVVFEDLFKNFELILNGVRTGVIRVLRPDNLVPLTLDQLADLGKRLAADYKVDLKINQTLLEPLVSDQTDTRVWVEKEPSEALETKSTPSPTREELEALKEEIEEAEEALKEETPAPAEEPAPSSAPVEAAPTDPSPPEAKVEEPQASVSQEREALLKKSRGELNKLAKEKGVHTPEKLPGKTAVVDAILSAQKE